MIQCEKSKFFVCKRCSHRALPLETNVAHFLRKVFQFYVDGLGAIY